MLEMRGNQEALNLKPEKNPWPNRWSFASKVVAPFGWHLVKKTILQGSQNKTWNEQTNVIKDWAIAHGMDPKMIKRRRAVEAVYDIFSYYGANRKWILRGSDWTSSQALGWRFVHVDRTHKWLSVSVMVHPYLKNPNLGVYPSW
jgi:hypothetical protein